MSQELNISKNKDRFVDYLAEAPNLLSVFIFSIFYNIASLMLIEMSSTTGIEVTDLGLIFTFYTIGAVTGQLTSVFYNRRFTRLQVTISSYIILIPLIIVLIFNYNLIVFYLFYLLGGYILGVIWIQANEFVLENKIKNKERIITILLTFYPIGALVAPFISSNIIGSGLSWRFSYYVIIFLVITNIILYMLVTARKKDVKAKNETEKINIKKVFRNKIKNIIFILAFCAITIYTCAETVIATWAPTFFRITKGLDIQDAGFLITLFWLFIVIGRGISLTIAGKVRSTIIMVSILPIAIIAMSVIIFIDSKAIIYFLIIMAGLGYSAMFPLLFSTGSTIYEKGRGMLATGLFVGSNIGISIAPFMTKFISKINLFLSLYISAILMSAVLVLVVVIHIISKRKKIF